MFGFVKINKTLIMRFKLYLTFSLFFLSTIVFAQGARKITGTVLDTDGFPLIGASVLIQGTDEGTSVDEQGVFELSAKDGQVLVVSYVFYQTKQIKVGAASHYNIVLESDQQVLDDVVVVAYGTTSKEAVTGAVAMVGTDAITKRPATNALSAIEGAAAGVRVNNTSGQPGSTPDIRIRGFSSLTSNSPLYVVDGVPMAGSSSDFNPNDSESISILKDASAATLYGNRASNGVVLITTKAGSKGKGFFGVDIKQGLFTRGMSEYDKLGPDDYMNVMWTGYRNSLMHNNSLDDSNQIANSTFVRDVVGLNIYNLPDDQLFIDGKLNPEASILPGYASDLDWFKAAERTGYYQDINMNGRVSNEKGGAYFSGSFLNNEGYLKKSDFKRFTARVNADYQVKEWLKVGANLSGSHQIHHGVNGDDTGSYTNPFMYARSIAPIYPIHKHDLATGEYLVDDYGNYLYDDGELTRKQFIGRHVLWENELNKQESRVNNLNAQFYTDIKFLNDFTFTLKADLNLRDTEARKYENQVVGDGKGNNGRSRRDVFSYKTYTFQQLLNWEKSFGDHNVDALLGHENYSNEYNYLYGMKTNQNFAGIPDLINFNDITNFYDYLTTYRTEGYFSRARYNYANKYFLEGSFRRDGSSKFDSKTRWGNFWSVGGSYVISNEDFFKIKEIDYLKVRASYGEVGNDGGAGTYAYQDLYGITKNGGGAAIYKTQIGNKDLKWETSSSFNIGVDARLFKRMNLTVEYFDKRSQNLLFNLNRSLSNGSTSTGSSTSTITSNVGSISNQGIEVSFDVDILKNKDWRWNFAANATWLKNKIVRLPEENRENGIITGSYKRMEGKSIYEYYMYQFVGVDQMTGNSLYEIDWDAYSVGGTVAGTKAIPDEYLVQIGDNYYTTYTTYGKRDWSGNSLPKVDGSFSTTLDYKNFSFSAVFTYGLGGKILDGSYAGLMSVSRTPYALHSDNLGAWSGVPEGMTNDSPNRIDPNGIPVIDFERNGKNNATSNRHLQNGNYLVIKNIGVNYSLPENIVQRLNLSRVSFNLGVENLYTFTKLKGMNPQYSYAGSSVDAWVTPRTYMFGVSVGF